MILKPEQAKAFYDRFGMKQDTQAFYEDAALDDMIAHASFDRAGSVFEFGCGTGRFALRLLQQVLQPSATYLGIDISNTMVDIAQTRVSPFAGRATVALSDGAMKFPLDDHSVDRVVSTYVLDLLSEDDIVSVYQEARRVLTPQGKLCLVSLTQGSGFVSRLITGVWSGISRMYAPLVGGCRPVFLESFVDPTDWSVEYHHVITQFGVPSEVLIAVPK